MVAARLLTEMGRYAQADSVLAAHPPVSGEDPHTYYLQRAMLNLFAGRASRANDLARAIDSTAAPDVQAYRDLVLAKAALESHRFLRALNHARSVHSYELPSVVADAMCRIEIEALAGLGRFGEALDAAARLDGAPDADGLARRYKLEVDAGRVQQARTTARYLALHFPAESATREVADALWKSEGARTLDADELLDWADYYIGQEVFDRARQALNAPALRHATRARTERRRVLRADMAFREGNYRRAAKLATPKIHTVKWKRLSVLILARAERKLDHPARSARLYEMFARDWPNDYKAADALRVAREMFQKARDRAGAARVDARLRRSYPSSIQGRRSAIDYALRLARNGHHAEALALMTRQVRRSRGRDESALYYLSRIYERTGEARRSSLLLNQLRDMDPYSFYLHPSVASGREGVPVRGASGSVAIDGPFGLAGFLARVDSSRHAAYVRIRGRITSQSDAPVPEAFSECVSRGEWLLSVGMRDWGEEELRVARDRCAGSVPALLELGQIYDRWAMPWRSVRAYQRASDRTLWRVRREITDDYRILLYPTPHPVQVFDNSAAYGLPANLVYAMIREESHFEPGAVSRAGAVGLMQLMPATARRVAHELDVPGWKEDDLLDPRVNLAFGIWYAGKLYERSGHRVHWMLAAYNAGPRNARRWFQGDRDVIDAVDSIDFRETNGYVRRIVESANIYHDLYFSAASRSSQ